MKTIVFVLGFVFLFAGCAPRYVIRNQYIPPLDTGSRACLKNCSKAKQKCKQKCAEDYSDCLSYAYDKAKQIQIKSDKNYKKRYNRYQARLNDYNFNIFDWQNRYEQRYSDWKYFSDKCSKNGDNYACERENELSYIIKKLSRSRPREPKAPKYITFEETLAKQQNRCVEKCGCDDVYDSCFIGCGGEIIPHRICVKNCD
ncbi:MAG: hypothetical protein QM482_05925 [Sulfurospirillum sp.]